MWYPRVGDDMGKLPSGAFRDHALRGTIVHRR